MKTSTRILALLLVLMALCPLITIAQEKPYLKDTSPVDLEIFINYSWYGNNWEDPAAKRITDETGVALKISKPVADDNQKLTLMINSGDLPDMILIDKNNPLYPTLIRSGHVADIDSLINAYAPEMKNYLDSEVLTNYLWEDGKTYAITTNIEGKKYLEVAKEYNGLIGSNQPVWAVRSDYYDEIGRPDMTTPEDFIAALEKMYALHPDKIGFYVGDGGFINVRPSLSVMGTQMGIPSYIVNDDKTLSSNIYSQEFEDTMMFLYQLASKGLLTRDSFIDNSEVATAKCNNGDPITYSWTIGDCQKIPADNPDTSYEILPPFASYRQTRTGAGWNALFINKNSPNLERVMNFLSYLSSHDGYAAVQYGILANEGETYSGDVVTGPHYYMDGDKPTAFLEYYADKQKDWNGVAKANGLGEYWLIASGLQWNLHFWNKEDEMYSKYNKQYGDLISYAPAFDNLNPDPASDEGVIRSKLDTLFETSSVKIVFAKSEEEAREQLAAFIAKSEEIGLEKVEAVWTEKYQDNLAKMGQ